MDDLVESKSVTLTRQSYNLRFWATSAQLDAFARGVLEGMVNSGMKREMENEEKGVKTVKR